MCKNKLNIWEITKIDFTYFLINLFDFFIVLKKILMIPSSEFVLIIYTFTSSPRILAYIV